MGVGGLALSVPASARDDEAEKKRPDRERADPQPPRPPRPDGERERDRPRTLAGGPLLRALDANRDGKLDKSEIENAAAALKKLDRNDDGEITREELGGGIRPGDQPRPDQPRPDQPRLPDLSALDKVGDGKISKEEAPERMKERFERAFMLCYGRAATEAEIDATREFFSRFETAAGGDNKDRATNRLLAFTTFCQSLFASAEFRYLN